MRARGYSSSPRAVRPGNSSPFSKQPKSTRRGFAKRFTGLLVLAVTLTLLALSLYVSTKVKVTVDSTAYHPASAYQAAASTQISSLNDRSKVSFNSNQLILKLRSQFPEINKVSVELPLFSTIPVVHVHISNPQYILQTGSEHFILNSQGVAVDAKPLVGIKSKLLTIQDKGHFNLSSGTQVLSAEDLNFINQVIAQCKRAKVYISSLVLPPVAEELDLRPAGANYFVKFFLGGDSSLEAGQYLAARHHFETAKIQPSQYLDVRVAGKIFYK